MVDKKLWHCLIYAVILFAACVTLWQMTTDSEISRVAVYTLYSSNSTYSYPIVTLPSDDYQRLIDLKNFSFTILNLPCNDSSPLLLVLVHSNPKNFKTRRIVRETWGQNTFQIKVLFVTGLIKDSSLRTKVDKENEEFRDFIQGSFIDAYRNITYKHVMVFKYSIYYCPQAKYILKTDDDVFVNMPLMTNFLTVDLSPFGGSRMIFCSVKKRSMVLRSWRSKWRVSFKEYPAKRYPPYCPGWSVLYSPDVVFQLYREAQRTGYFWIDDVHITGTLVERIHVTHVNVENLVLTRRAMSTGLAQPSKFNQSFLYGPFNIRNHEIRTLWEHVKSQDGHVSVLKHLS